MFERQSMEQLVTKMVRWTRGVSPKLTDFRVGSKIRTIYESTALVVEELYDKVFRSMRSTIEENIYAVIGFNKEPATYAGGNVVMSRDEPADDNYLIPAGTTVLSRATQFRAPIQYITTEDTFLQVGTTSVIVPVVSTVAGLDGNIGAGEIDEFLSKPTGIDFVTNTSAIEDGQAEESTEEQKYRFQEFIVANARGVMQSVEYGANTAQLVDANGVVTEDVKMSVAVEYAGYLEIFIWNGVGLASEALKSQVVKIQKGYYDENGNPVYGYKPAGIPVTVYTAPMKYVTIKMEVTPEDWASYDGLRVSAEQVVDLHFRSLRQGQTLIQTALEAEIKFLEGMKDVKLYLSTDGDRNYDTLNVTAEPTEIIVASKPIQFDLATTTPIIIYS